MRNSNWLKRFQHITANFIEPRLFWWCELNDLGRNEIMLEEKTNNIFCLGYVS